jgi:hypothetical protein
MRQKLTVPDRPITKALFVLCTKAVSSADVTNGSSTVDKNPLTSALSTRGVTSYALAKSCSLLLVVIGKFASACSTRLSTRASSQVIDNGRTLRSIQF